MKDKLAIFDLDGTLFDTRKVNYYAYKEALKIYSIDLPENYFFSACFGKNYKDFLPEIVGDNSLVEEIHKKKQELYSNYFDKVRKNIHLFNYIEKIRDEYYVAIVTTASKKNTWEILEYYGYEAYFDMVVTAEDIVKVKPNPEGFIKVMDSFNIGPEQTSIFEDSSLGIEAAKKTGATVFSVEQF